MCNMHKLAANVLVSDVLSDNFIYICALAMQAVNQEIAYLQKSGALQFLRIA